MFLLNSYRMVHNWWFEEPRLCQAGFHECNNLNDLWSKYYESFLPIFCTGNIFFNNACTLKWFSFKELVICWNFEISPVYIEENRKIWPIENCFFRLSFLIMSISTQNMFSPPQQHYRQTPILSQISWHLCFFNLQLKTLEVHYTKISYWKKSNKISCIYP